MSRSRRKLDTSPIEYDDVVDSPALKGMVSFLEVPPGKLPQLDFTQPESNKSGAPLSGPPEQAIPERAIPKEAIPGTDTPQKGSPVSGIPPSPIPQPTIPVAAYPPVLSRPLARVRRATLAQDGHSFGEQALYEALWQHAHPHGPDTRIITLGYRRMADLARLTVNNCKANIQSLIQKLAVEEVASFTHSQGRTYLVFSYTAIIQRRRENGLTHFIKSRGVVFVDPDTGEPLTARIRDKSGIPFSQIPGAAAVPEGGRGGVPEPALQGVPEPAGTPYSQTLRQSFRNPTPSSQQVPIELIRGLRQLVSFVDDEAAGLLWRQCRRRAADCTAAEILHFARAKATLFRSGKIQNPTGFLLAAVPKCFEGSGLSEHREEQARLQQLETERIRDAEDQMARMRREFEAILHDPEASDEDRRFVRRMLEGN